MSRISRRRSVSKQRADATSTPSSGLLCLHLFVLLVAGICGVSGPQSFGLSSPDVSDYSPIQIFVYLAAYILGISAYGAFRRRTTLPGWVATAGWIVCTFGVLSLALETWYRLRNSHMYWPYTSPLLSLLIGLITLALIIFQQWRHSSPAARRH